MDTQLQIVELGREHRHWVVQVLVEQWSSVNLVRRGMVTDATQLPGFIAKYDGRAAGLILFEIQDRQCEIVALASYAEGRGIGTALIEAVKQRATESGCTRLWLITTNDNLKAIRFYQKRGLRLAALYPNALEESRKLKPEIPFMGMDGIPLRDEIELELLLDSA